MRYTATDILTALKTPQGRFRNLENISIERDCYAQPRYWIGNNCVVVKVTKESKTFAMRCYLNQQRDSRLSKIYGEAYHPKELRLTGGGYVDVVLCRWVEGVSLTSAVERAILMEDERSAKELSRAFDRLAIEMLNQHRWAHGDLSGDNIIVGEDGSMSLIDLDASYTEELNGYSSLELGTPSFQSTLRTAKHLDATIDDFSIALISTALHALACDINISKRHQFLDGILINGQRVADECYSTLNDIIEMFLERGLFAEYRVAKLLRLNTLHLDKLLQILTFSSRGIAAANAQLALISSDGAWGYYSTTSGEMVIPPLFDEAFEFRDGEALVRIEERWFYINMLGVATHNLGVMQGGKPPIKRNR